MGELRVWQATAADVLIVAALIAEMTTWARDRGLALTGDP